MGKNSKEYEMAIKIAGQVEQSFKNSMGLTERELRSIARQAATTGNAARHSLGSGFEDANKVIDSFSSGAVKAMRAVATAAATTATAVGGIAAASIKVGSDFEAQMSSVEAISGATESQMKSLNDKAKDLGETTAFSASQAGEAMEYMAMAGWKTKDMLNGIDGVMSLAAASGEELGTVSDIVTDAMTAFGMSADKAGDFSDVLAKTASSANTNVSMMGETFKYVAPVAGSLGYNVEEIATAIGLMANSGIKASSAGTSLRSWMSRMASPTDQVATAMEKLGISLTDEEGNMYSFKEIMEKTREAFSHLTKAQKSQYASAIAGKSGMSGMLAVVNASEKDFKKLTKQIENSTGAAKEMADIKLDNLQGDTTLFKSASEGLGIEIYEQMDDGLREIVQSITSEVGNITEYLRENRFIEEFSEGIKENIPTMIRNMKNAGESIEEFAEPFINVAGWMLEHPEVIESTLTGIVTAIVSLKAAEKIYGIATSFGTLAGVLTNPFALAILGVGVALGGAAGLATYIKKCEIAAKNQNLAGHFGEISLSMEELRDVANRIVDDGSITRLNSALEEFSKVDSINGEIDNIVSSLDKMNWKVEIGMELSDSEKKQYREDIKAYISQTQDLVAQERYAISLNMNILTDGNGEMTSQVDSYFSGKQAELEKLGKKLQKTVNRAFDDGLLTIDEEQKIQDIQAQMAEISDGLTKSNFEANMQIIQKEYEGTELDADSFKNLQDELQSQVDEAQKGYKEALQESLAVEASMLSDGSITQDQYEKNVDELWNSYNEKVGEAQKNASDFELSTIMGQYNDEITEATNSFDEILEQYMSRQTDWTNESGAMWDHFTGQFEGELTTDDTAAAIGDLITKLEPAKENLAKLKQSYENTIQSYEQAGEEVPKDITQGLQEVENSLNQITQLEAFSGDEASLWEMIQQSLLSNEDYTAMIEKVQEQGGYIPEEIKAGMETKAQEAANAGANTTWDTTDNALQSKFEDSFEVGVKVNTKNETTTNAIKTASQDVRTQMSNFLTQEFSSTFDLAMKVHASTTKTKDNIAHNAKGNIVTKPILTWFAEEGPEAAIPLDGSERAKSLWYTAGEMLGMYNGVSEDTVSFASQAEQMMNRDESSLKTSKSLSALERSETNNNQNITYAPQITIKGNASKEDIMEANDLSFEKFERMMEKYTRNRTRTAF